MSQTKGLTSFRQYVDNPTEDDSPIAQRVFNTYKQMHTYQCVDFVRKQYDRWLKFDHLRLSMYEVLEKLNAVVDESDPDVDVPNIYHAFQTAEGIRKAYPDQDWFHLTGLIHDCGKLLALFNEPQWAVVGDTFPVGCQFSEKIVYRPSTFANNPDLNNEIYSTKYGMYTPNCGLDRCLMSWGHDEYLYRVLINHPMCTLPDEGLYIIRYHSFYPWHTGNDYMYLCNEKDLQMLEWVRRFQKFDLYTKDDQDLPNIDELKPYYLSLIEKYIPGIIAW
ncbi:hypothetical protein I4U23_018682 [Adineta vaga]|nr:hypothetical protein I4U23_018682 [Adineta vaga]